MINYTKKFKLFNVYERWFQFHFNWKDAFSMVRLLHLKNKPNRFIPAIRNITHTVELNLEPEIDTIFSSFSNTIKQEIKKSKAEGVICTLNNHSIEFFVSFYNEFAQAKNIYTTSVERINEMKEFFYISYAQLNDEVLVAHSYLVDPKMKIVRLFHSANRRLDTTIDSKLIGRANKCLTFEDIVYFKDLGIEIMDFGGYANNTTIKSLKGINDFKLAFGGKVVECIDYDSIFYFIVKNVFEIFKKRKTNK
jgi:lipid II:glycine glycyltransferase (peptidoglycan interpeptide bridge formation enzyme)